ncbi:MAG: UDP-3-O-(3-hydroxymyristoyl)glucosamine N-acyltransferase [Saprospirales bacterium]|nr:UDP-3-O-(3-hydroxymyristoyl)glucosamine N-acyltransferase [Saprospirales bacterium]MBK8490057.1 UDP-3-O-(3-hydroxymyristoyl)glucosamine N-acyltransferase [Saprospirales bacterium]
MKLPLPIPVRELAKKIGAKLIGDETLFATGINEIHKVEPGDVTFSDVAKYFKRSLESEATIIILNEATICPDGKAILVVENPFEAYDSLVREFRPFRPLTASISEEAHIHPTAIIEPNVVIAHGVRIGAHCYIQANVYIGEHTVIGDHVTIQAGAIIGTDAFYYKKTEKGFTKWRSGGRVVIEDHVEIGSGCTINKGVSGDTIIGEGTKMDSQVHIGHGAVIGKNCLIAGQVGIGGKTIIEDEVVLYGQVGVIQAVRVGKGAIVLAGAGVSKDLEGGKAYFGAPADESSIRYRELAALRHLPDFLKNFYAK